jgi:aspartate/methionine/tyrosine aminotransferase
MSSSSLLSNRVTSSQESSTVRIADKARLLMESGEVVYDFSAGRAFESTPKYVVEAMFEGVRQGETHQTMARGTTRFREACAIKLKRENHIVADPEREIIATMGVKQGLTIALLTLLNPGDEVIVEDPCFVSYKQTIQYLGGVPVPVPLRPENNYRWDSDELSSAITDKTKAIILCSPQNPTGVVHTQEDLSKIAEIAMANDLVVITDEVYERITWGGRKHLNLASFPGMYTRTITLMSLTKSFAMGGWRIGFVYASAEIIDQMEKLQQHLITSVSSLSQAGGCVAFSEPPHEEVLGYWSEWEQKVRYFTSSLDQINGLKCAMPEGAFYGWTNISALGISSEEFVDALLEDEKVALIHGSSFGQMGRDYVRITCVKSYEEIEEGIKRIKRFVEQL